MPDASGSLNTPTSPLVERLARLKLMRRKGRSEERRKRRWLKNQLVIANILLADIIDGADIVAEVVVTDDLDPGTSYRVQSVCLLVTLPVCRFGQLCEFGAELEDLEDSHDAEDEPDEPSLASAGSFNQEKWSAGHPLGSQSVDAELDKADDEPSGDEIEPSLGALNGWGASDQRDWAASDRTDREHDGDDLEPDADNEPDERQWPQHPRQIGPTPQTVTTEQAETVVGAIEEARSGFETAAGCKVIASPALDPDGKPGAWLLLQRSGGQK